jgi:CBS-domain-containing membrane protein
MVAHEEDPADALLVLFEQRDLNAVPVVDAEGHLVGVVTKLSLLPLFRQVTGRGIADPADCRACGCAT